MAHITQRAAVEYVNSICSLWSLVLKYSEMVNWGYCGECWELEQQFRIESPERLRIHGTMPRMMADSKHSSNSSRGSDEEASVNSDSQGLKLRLL